MYPGLAGAAALGDLQGEVRSLWLIFSRTRTKASHHGSPEATNRARQAGDRRSHHHITPPQVQYCSQCNEPVLPHRVCPNCSYYQGREAVPPKEEKKK